MKNIISLTIFSILLTGCMSIPKMDLSALKSPGPVTTVVVAWEPAVSGGDKPMRGFGGRVYFYDQDKDRPVKVAGTVVVYAFDEEGRSAGDTKPNEGFVFDAKMLKGVYTKTKLGHSYNLWIPWDAAGPEGQAKKISLIVRYTPKQGKGSTVVSSQTTAYLPGRNSPTLMAGYTERQEEGTIQQMAASRPTMERQVPQRARLTEERVIESNAHRPATMQSVTIR